MRCVRREGVGALGAELVNPIKVNELIKGYSEDPLFNVDLNKKLMIKNKGLWWKDDKLVIPNMERK